MSNIIQFPPGGKGSREPSPPHSPTPPPKANRNLWPAGAALCMMLMAVPFANQYVVSNKNHRGLASADDQQTEKQNQADKQNEKILRDLKQGRREIASVGKRPNVKDHFLIHQLQFRYETYWQDGGRKLSRSVVRNDQEPLVLPMMPVLVKSYPSLFPEHHQMVKDSYFSQETETYQLLDEQGLNIGMIEAVRDEKGRVLSIYIQ